jgi:glycine/D-amino acid oxidase-like deaminating enzyme
MGPEGAFMAAALSGHGTMAACASGELAAAWVAGAALPDCARPFSQERFEEGSGLGPGSEESGLL